MNKIDSDDSIRYLIKLAIDAGKLIKVQSKKKIKTKDDMSPLTLADIASNDLITKGLNSKYKNIPIVSEEIANIQT